MARRPCCLLSRALQTEAIESTSITWRDAIAGLVRPGRVVFTKLPRGATLGTPGDAEQQLRLLSTTLGLLGQELPTKPVVRTATLTREV